MQELAVSYEDLLKAEERGRWWIVGSAWSERENKFVSSKYIVFINSLTSYPAISMENVNVKTYAYPTISMGMY